MASTSPPPGGGPSPMMIGRNFIKRYYQVLSTAPENIVKFYKPVSVFSHGQGSEPTTPATIAESTNVLLKDRLFSSDNFRVDLERGAIDAQSSVDGGVLVVVTGHLFMGEEKRAFSHTFFLIPSSDADSARKQYYVHNDIMRFLAGEVTAEEEAQEEGEAEQEVAAARVTPEASVADNRQEEVLPETTQDTPAAPISVKEAVLESEVASEPAVAAEETPLYEPALEPEQPVEETKEDIVVEEQKDTKPKRKSKSRRRKSHSPTTAEDNKAQPPPESWASRVAHNSTTPAPPSPSRRTTEKKEKEAPVKEEAKLEKPLEQQQQQYQGKQQRGPKLRDPDCTLVIKNVPEGTKERDVREMFEPFAVEMKSKIIGLNVSVHKSLAFVDFDSPEPVAAALKQKGQLQLNGRTLDLEPKLVDKSRGKQYRSRSQGGGEGGSSNGFRGSGRSGHRRRGSGGGRGDRGGGGGGRGGRGGR